MTTQRKESPPRPGEPIKSRMRLSNLEPTGDAWKLSPRRIRASSLRVEMRGFTLNSHFMGKKSVMDTPMLPSAEGQGVDALEVTLPGEQSALGELFQEFLRVALQAQVDPQESRSKNQEADLLMKILGSYIQSRK
ncbi:hypothetical protein INR49_016270 [Caranx melampygus]|nr:hypothetical protein INR49_016270 [Caranx melampygus]